MIFIIQCSLVCVGGWLILAATSSLASEPFSQFKHLLTLFVHSINITYTGTGADDRVIESPSCGQFGALFYIGGGEGPAGARG